MQGSMNMSESRRFLEISDDTVKSSSSVKYADGSNRAAKSSYKQFKEFLDSSSLEEPSTALELNNLLRQFILAARKKNSTDYKSASLSVLVHNIVRYYSVQWYDKDLENNVENPKLLDFDRDTSFTTARNVLTTRMASLQQQNTDSDEAVQAAPFSKEELDRIFDSNLLDASTPAGLLRRLFFVIGLNTAARISFHVNCKWSDILPTETDKGRRFRRVRINGDKNHQYGRDFSQQYYYLFEMPSQRDRCALTLLDQYASHRPAKAKDRLYLGINHMWNSSSPSSAFYKISPMGLNLLATIVPTVAKAIGLDGKRYSTHSLRSTLPTILYHQNIDEQLISEITKHRSNDGLRSYKRTSTALVGSAVDRVLSSSLPPQQSILAAPIVLDDLPTVDVLPNTSTTTTTTTTEKKSTQLESLDDFTKLLIKRLASDLDEEDRQVKLMSECIQISGNQNCTIHFYQK